MNKFKKILARVHRGKILILLGAISFTYFSYSINAQNDFRGFMFGMLMMDIIPFVVVAGALVFINKHIATIVFLVITILFLFNVDRMMNTTEYLYKKALDPCYRMDNVRYIGKGPWEYELSGRVCIGERVGDTITYKTRE